MDVSNPIDRVFMAFIAYFTFVESEILTVSDLYLLNVNLVDVSTPVKFGCALGLKQATVERIRNRYSYQQHFERCFSEILAAWLNEEDRPHELPGPNWGEVITALKTVGMMELADHLLFKYFSKCTSEANYLEDSKEAFNSVDNSELCRWQLYSDNVKCSLAITFFSYSS